MKYGYRCSCGEFNLSRGSLTRKKYAEEKSAHAKECSLLAKELEVSKNASSKGAKNSDITHSNLQKM